MPQHGHVICPHCDADLQGAEATCPSCSGPLFGIAPKQTNEVPVEAVSGTTTIDNVAVPTYTPPATSELGEPISQESNIVADANQDLTTEDYVQRGEMLGIEGRHAEALRMFNQAISMDPTNHMAWFNRGVMSETTGDVQDAIKAFQIALDNNPGHGAASANLAVLLQRLGHPDDSVQHAQNGLIAFPGHPALLDIVNSAGAAVPVTPISIDKPEDEVQEQSENQEEIVVEDEPWAEPLGSVKALDPHPVSTVPEPEPDNPSNGLVDLDSLAESATAMIRSGDSASALESLRPHLPESAAEHAPCWRAAAGAMARLDLIDAAINAFEYALDLDPNDASSCFNLGALKRRNGDLAAALDCFQKTVALDQNHTKAANALAQAGIELGDIESAISGYRCLLAIDPGHPSGVEFAELLINIAEGEGRIIELDSTLPRTLPAGPEMALEALQHLPENELILRARATSIAGHHAESVTLWKGLLELNKDDPDLWLGLARSLSAAGSEDKAISCRDKARSLGAEIDEPVIETTQEPQPDLDTDVVETEAVEITAHETDDDEDPWAALQENVVEIEVESAPQISTEEIIAHEAALDTIEEPEVVTHEPVSVEVDLAAAALEAQAGIMSTHEVQADSSSVSNQDIEWYNKGIELLNKDRYKEALSCFDRALPSFKNDKAMAIKILNGRGNCFYYLNEYKEAIENYFNAFGIDKGLTKGSALYNMGTAYAELESFDNAIHCFNQSFGNDVGEPLSGEHKKRAKEQIRRCKLLLKEQKKNA